jgi:hydrogenase maturation protease
MKSTGKQTLVLGLGNDVLGDDAVGVYAARALREQYGDAVDVVEAAVGGFALIDLLEGYDRAILLDAVATGHAEPGTVMEFVQEDFGTAACSSPHYVGLPEVFAVADRLSIPLPHDLRILAMEIVPPEMLSQSLGAEVQKALPQFVERAASVLNEWRINCNSPHLSLQYHSESL